MRTHTVHHHTHAHVMSLSILHPTCDPHHSLHSHCCERHEVADVGNVPSLCGSLHGGSFPGRQEAQVHHQVQEQQLDRQVQRDFPVVSCKVQTVPPVRLSHLLKSTLKSVHVSQRAAQRSFILHIHLFSVSSCFFVALCQSWWNHIHSVNSLFNYLPPCKCYICPISKISEPKRWSTNSSTGHGLNAVIHYKQHWSVLDTEMIHVSSPGGFLYVWGAA